MSTPHTRSTPLSRSLQYLYQHIPVVLHSLHSTFPPAIEIHRQYLEVAFETLIAICPVERSLNLAHEELLASQVRQELTRMRAAAMSLMIGVAVPPRLYGWQVMQQQLFRLIETIDTHLLTILNNPVLLGSVTAMQW